MFEFNFLFDRIRRPLTWKIVKNLSKMIKIINMQCDVIEAVRKRPKVN